ncbi:hypothetical protein GCM10007320_22890 [Pseudorhodoferax aquiterrae]|uniref:Peptide chain release factor 2 n=1 Tax=Pseudorhodoferax aquiterrae TaxID=747304 RepID=A0ABQ3G1H0_9BURK|nr:hypothetical protein GCM10007320_22890 [Pseudorhodoferax aquiterrae]
MTWSRPWRCSGSAPASLASPTRPPERPPSPARRKDSAGGGVRMRKSHVLPQGTTEPSEITMDAEHINQIGTQLTDLAARTQELRGYL